MRKKYPYNKVNAIAKGFTALGSTAYLVALLLFAALLGIYYIESLGGIIDLGELERAVNKIYLRLDAFILIGCGVSLLGFIFCSGMTRALNREKGGFRGFVLMLISAALIVFYAVIMTSGVKYGYVLNYAFGGILLVGILGFLLGLTAIVTRLNVRRKVAKKVRQFERNYLKFEKYNR